MLSSLGDTIVLDFMAVHSMKLGHLRLESGYLILYDLLYTA